MADGKLEGTSVGGKAKDATGSGGPSVIGTEGRCAAATVGQGGGKQLEGEDSHPSHSNKAERRHLFRGGHVGGGTASGDDGSAGGASAGGGDMTGDTSRGGVK